MSVLLDRFQINSLLDCVRCDNSRAAVRRSEGMKALRIAVENSKNGKSKLSLKFPRAGVDADPNAEPIYRRSGFVTIGHVPSRSILGRMLPRMEMTL